MDEEGNKLSSKYIFTVIFSSPSPSQSQSAGQIDSWAPDRRPHICREVVRKYAKIASLLSPSAHKSQAANSSWFIFPAPIRGAVLRADLPSNNFHLQSVKSQKWSILWWISFIHSALYDGDINKSTGTTSELACNWPWISGCDQFELR